MVIECIVMQNPNPFPIVRISYMSIEFDEDQATIKRVLDGEYDEFEKLVEKYQGRIYRHLRKMVKDNQLAEDLLQETFLNAYRGLEGFSGTSSFSTWLFRIATNNALMFLRKNRPESVEYDDAIRNESDFSFMTASSEFARTPQEILISEEGRRKIEEAIESLPVMYRSVIVLRDVEGFSLEEVSEIMNSSIAAVKSRLHRARNAVRETLTAYYMEKDLSLEGGN
ncbi:MAG: sigma-70 family RNA polymerase sigma factor [Deltaproteobacteria bacterium]